MGCQSSQLVEKYPNEHYFAEHSLEENSSTLFVVAGNGSNWVRAFRHNYFEFHGCSSIQLGDDFYTFKPGWYLKVAKYSNLSFAGSQEVKVEHLERLEVGVDELHSF